MPDPNTNWTELQPGEFPAPPGVIASDQYAAGFYDAGDGEPLYPDAPANYRLGWLARHECKRIIEEGPCAK